MIFQRMMTMEQIRIKNIIAPHFWNTFNSRKINQIYQGGRNSTKTSMIALKIVFNCLNNDNCSAVALRNHKTDLRKSVYKEIKRACKRLTLIENIDYIATVSPMEIKFNNGNTIYFAGGDDFEAVKGTIDEDKLIKIVWFEELTGFKDEETIEQIKATFTRGNNDWFMALYSFNPPKNKFDWVNKWVDSKRELKDYIINHSDYRTVPVEWVGKIAIQEAKTLRENDEKRYLRRKYSDVDLYLGSMNASYSAINKNVEMMLLLGFFLSLIFRYNDEYKKKDLKVWGKIVGLSLLTGVIGMTAFAIGANLMCLMLTALGTTFIPWYCSLPAYLLFSISVSLALTIKSTIPVKSALLGGLCSALIGFIVLYCSSRANNTSGWMNMLLDFIIYGGGLGASLVTVRMLAEKYFLVIQNGVRAGQRIPIHKWMNATGGGNKVSIGMTGECEIQMNWEKSNKVAKEHVQLFIDYDKQLPMLKPLATGVIFNTRAELPVGRPSVLSNGDNFKIGDTIFLYQETE